jgi:hypothetical protein
MPKRGSGTELLSAWIMEALRFGAMIKGLGYRWVGFVMQLEFAEALILFRLLYDDNTFVSDFYVALSRLPSCLDGCLSRGHFFDRGSPLLAHCSSRAPAHISLHISSHCSAIE